MTEDTNTVTVIGRLARDADLKPAAGGGMAVGFFTIASNRKKKDQSGVGASYFDVNVYGRYAEEIAPRLKKGSCVCVAGSMKQERWLDRATGAEKSRVVIAAASVQILRRI